MEFQKKEKTKAAAATKDGMDEKTARKYILFEHIGNRDRPVYCI